MATEMGGRLQGRVCVVAGALGVLGEGVARRFADEGGIVAGLDRKAHDVGRLALQVDLLDEEAIRGAYARIHQEFGRVDVIYNNAGLIDPADHSALDTDLETWSRVIAGNLTTTYLSCKHGIPFMLRNDPPKGSVINTASFLAGMGAASAQMAFNAAKAAVEQLSRDLGVQLARSGVRVNALALGPIETPQLRQVFDRIGSEETARRFVHMPMGRFGTIAELAATAAYLASDDAGFVTAASIPLNGGIPGAFTVALDPPR
ncbi:SDR family oxidoreductase [Beijerinckia sp. L45]|uniref:SDR family oxidoreductase n=1 Tax=Beijerinckia sp. L45 TaxID=1641855 RepID=UPI001AED7F6C|nr:SDR family oxidoreductase [Beijerinckia sp. L45]